MYILHLITVEIKEYNACKVLADCVIYKKLNKTSNFFVLSLSMTEQNGYYYYYYFTVKDTESQRV